MQAIAFRALAALGPLTQHLGSYAQLGVAAAGEYRAAIARRICWAVAAVVFGLAGLAATWMIGVVAFWDTPWRLTYVIASAVVLLVLAGIAAYLAMSVVLGGGATRVLRTELHKDRELFEEWTRSL